MRILFILRHEGYVRLFESSLRELAARGHNVLLAFEQSDQKDDPVALVERLCELPGIDSESVPRRDDRWGPLSGQLRHGIDYLRYLEPEYREAPKLRARAARSAPWVAALTSRLRGRRWHHMVDGTLRRLDRAVPDDPRIARWIAARRPDLVLITPLVAEPHQSDYVRAARTLGLRTALPVASWDNLTNKGLIRDQPDRVYVWNDAQRQEATELHRMPAERVTVTGAHAFDEWFDRVPGASASDFRRRIGLPDGEVLLLYLCSSKFVASAAEAPFVRRWIEALRSHPDPRLREARVLIRPHPRSKVLWGDLDLSDLGGVAVWPPNGAVNVSEGAKAGYFDSMYHAAACVGLNTSALIESAIVGRRSFTVLSGEFADTQEGTLHFRYLMSSNGGPLTVARSFDEHLRQLGDAIGETGATRDWNRDFLKWFVRPQGLESPSTPRLVAALEAQGRSPQPAPRLEHRRGDRVLRAAMIGPAVAARRGPRARRVAKRARRVATQVRSLGGRSRSVRQPPSPG